MSKPTITPRFERSRVSLIVCGVALILAGCSGPRELSGVQLAAAVQSQPAGTPAPAAAQIKRQLSPACPTPTQWTPAQGQTVATFMLAHETEPGMQLLAPEWERLNDGALICRGKKPATP